VRFLRAWQVFHEILKPR